MKKTVIALIVGAALVIGGAIMVAVGLYTGGGNTYATNIFALEERTATIDQVFESVVVETKDCDVNFVPFDGTADPHIVFLEREKIGHDVKVRGGVLTVKMTDHRQWMDYIRLGGKSMEMTIYLPRKQYESLRVTTDTGDIQLPEVLSAKEIKLSSDTGGVCCEAKAETLMDCETDTGDITVKNCTPYKLELQTDTGDVKVQESSVVEIHIETDTGEVDAENVNCTTFICKSDTGDVTLRQMKLAGSLQVFTNTGDVKIQDSDAVRINIETDTGDVRVPKAWKQKDYRIETDTGRIHFQ